MSKQNKVVLTLGATVCFAVSSVAFAQSGSAASGGQAAGAGAQSSGSRAESTGSGALGSTAEQSSASSTTGHESTTGHAADAGSADQKFAQDAAAGGLAEVEMGQLAADKASNEKVKQFGQRMVTDHSKANTELKTLASKKGLTLPDSPKPKDKSIAEKMSKLSGAAFDKAYMQDMVKDHQKDVAEFQKEASNGSDPDLKAWAGTTLPVLQEHLKMAKEALSAVNGSSTGTSQSSGQ
jgi:putative membrane protein